MRKGLLWLFIIVTTFALVITLGISGCKTTAAETTAAETTAAETTAAETTAAVDLGPIHALIYSWYTLKEEHIKEFTKSTGIEVQAELISYEDMTTKIATSSAANVCPGDVIGVWGITLASEVPSGFVEPLDAYISDELKKDLIGITAYEFNGKTYGVPANLDLLGLGVNNEMLEKASITSIPQTMDELSQACFAIKNAGVIDYPLLLALTADGGTPTRWYLLTLAYGGKLFDENYQPLFTTEGSAGYKALEFMIGNIGKIIDPIMIETTAGDADSAFLAGQGAFAFTPLAKLSSKKEDPEQSKIVGKASIELVPGSEEFRSACIDFFSDGFAISSLSQHKEAAWKFIEWWLSPENIANAYAEAGLGPARSSVLNELTDKGVLKDGKKIMEQGSYSRSIFTVGIPSWFEEWESNAANVINQAARGQITFNEALQNMADKAVELQK